MRKHLQETDLRFMADNLSNEIVIRTYDERGNSNDERRDSTAEEKQIIFKIAYATLCCLNHGTEIRSSREETQVAIDTAEFIIDQFLPDCNGYNTIYCPLQEIVREWEADSND